MNYILQTNSLTKKYKNFQALNGLTMNVPKGSIYGFVGKNGAGKTTLIRMICGLQEPTSGSFLCTASAMTARILSNPAAAWVSWWKHRPSTWI